MEDKDVSSLAYLRYELYNHEVGEKVEIEYIRNGKNKKIELILESKK